MDLEAIAALASTVELRVDSHIVPDGFVGLDYQGPELVAIAHGGRVVTLTPHGRTVATIAADHVQRLIELAVAAHEEVQPDGGFDTATARPITTFRLRIERQLRHLEVAGTISRNHYVPHALAPHWTALLAAFREAAGPLAPRAADAWDVGLVWMGPVELGELWTAGQPVPLEHVATAFEHAGPVYFRAGQPPQRSELYRFDGTALWHLPAAEPAYQVRVAPLLPWHGEQRWALPCGAGVLAIQHEWQHPPRIIVRIDDPARGIWVQRE